MWERVSVGERVYVGECVCRKAGEREKVSGRVWESVSVWEGERVCGRA